MALEDSKAALDAELAELKTRAENAEAGRVAAEARAADAEKKLQDALDSETSLTTWLDSRAAAIKAVIPA